MKEKKFSILIGEESKENPGTYRIQYVDNDAIWAERRHIADMYNEGYKFINKDKLEEILDLEAQFRAQEEEKARLEAKKQEPQTV